MKKFPAIAILEFDDIASGIFVTDAMIKKSPISLLKSGIISQGRYLTMIGGSTAAVDESYSEGCFWARSAMIDHVILPDIHPELHDAVLGKRCAGLSGSLAVLETPTVSANVRAAERALKSTPIRLAELRLAESHLGGKGISIYRGELHDVEAGIEAAVAYLAQSGSRARYRIIPAPHDVLSQQVDSGLYFETNGSMSLDGEDS